VIDQEVVVFVIAIGKREGEAAYQDAQDRISQQPAG
jgi:mRNA interferase RelE/StbE